MPIKKLLEKKGVREVWISRKKWSSLVKRVAALEKKNEEQPEKIALAITMQSNEEMSKTNRPHHPW